MLSLLPQPAVPLGRSVPALPVQGRELKKEANEQISLIWAMNPVPRAPGRCSHLPIAAGQPLPGKCRKMCLNPASFPEPSRGDAVVVPGWRRGSLTSHTIGQPEFPGWHLQAGALRFQQRPGGGEEHGGCCRVGTAGCWVLSVRPSSPRWAAAASGQVN